MFSSRHISMLMLLGTVLAGCSSKTAPLPCPRASILSEASHIVSFRDGGGRDLTDIKLEGDITSIDSSCKYIQSNTMIDMTVTVNIGVSRGPALAVGQADKVTYFVTVIDRLNQQVLNKATFDLPVKFPSGRTRLATGDNEQIGQRIPVKQGRTGADYEVIVGFQLTPEALDFNRKRR